MKFILAVLLAFIGALSAVALVLGAYLLVAANVLLTMCRFPRRSSYNQKFRFDRTAGATLLDVYPRGLRETSAATALPRENCV